MLKIIEKSYVVKNVVLIMSIRVSTVLVAILIDVKRFY